MTTTHKDKKVLKLFLAVKYAQDSFQFIPLNKAEKLSFDDHQ